MATDKYATNFEQAVTPARGAGAITPADSNLAEVTKSLYVGGAGNVSVRMADGDDVVFNSVPSGTILPIAVLQVRSGTTATNIVALY